jgi:hypothetical protein
MFIFRVEHKREFCGYDPRYRVGGSSPTGHGTYKTCEQVRNSMIPVPNFGLIGMPPTRAMMVHERCAVTAGQFEAWVGTDYSCRKESPDCNSSEGSCYCKPSYIVDLRTQWHIVAYWVEDDAEGIDWRTDNGQIVFNPAFATNMGAIAEKEIPQLISVGA